MAEGQTAQRRDARLKGKAGATTATATATAVACQEAQWRVNFDKMARHLHGGRIDAGY
jgi:hypothetical protein